MKGTSMREILAVAWALSMGAQPMLPGQAATAPVNTPTFEVASIRQNVNSNIGWSMYFTPDGVHAMDVTLDYAIKEAYGVYDNRLWSGWPAWIGQRRFDIEAKFDVARYPNITLEQRRAMLQQLMAGRFKLVVHHEMKQFPLYELVVAKGGSKLKEAKPDDIHRNAVYGAMCLHTRAGRGLLEVEGCSVSQFASSIETQAQNDLGRAIVDHTGFTGYYTIALHWTPFDPGASSPMGSVTPDASGPSIFTALKEQVGLELKPTTGPLDTIVVDHVEMPSEN